MLYTTLDLFLAELLSILAALVMNQLLANKDKNGWLFLLAFFGFVTLCFGVQRF
ncbi:MAG: hypothetical protein HC803_05845, partial [Saprospiraceae bacterium]|nr:hypothetical protein [Saprospiraceae bacterium]